MAKKATKKKVVKKKAARKPITATVVTEKDAQPVVCGDAPEQKGDPVAVPEKMIDVRVETTSGRIIKRKVKQGKVDLFIAHCTDMGIRSEEGDKFTFYPPHKIERVNVG